MLGSRRQLCDQGFDLTPLPVPGLREDGLVVLRREVRCQQAYGGQGQRSRRQELEDQGKSPAGPSGLDPVAGGIFGETKGLGRRAEDFGL